MRNLVQSSFSAKPHSSVSIESACYEGDQSSIPRSGRSPGERTGYPFQYSWTSLLAQLVKNPPAMWETWAWSLIAKIHWIREQLPTPVFWLGEFHGLYSSWGLKSQARLGDFHFTSLHRLGQDQGGHGEIIKSERRKQEGTQNIKNNCPTPQILRWVWVREGLTMEHHFVSLIACCVHLYFCQFCTKMHTALNFSRTYI